MNDTFQNLNFLFCEDPLFWFCALVGSLLFLTQFLSHILGATEEFDSGDSDSSDFKWLSKQTLTGFVMMFGWIGLTCKREFDLSSALSTFLALAGGLAAFFLTGLIFKTAKKAHSSGSVFKIENVLGKEAMVYHRITKDSAGKISLNLNDITYEIDALSQAEEIASFSRVQIIKKFDEKTVIVIPIK